MVKESLDEGYCNVSGCAGTWTLLARVQPLLCDLLCPLINAKFTGSMRDGAHDHGAQCRLHSAEGAAGDRVRMTRASGREAHRPKPRWPPQTRATSKMSSVHVAHMSSAAP